MSVSKFLSVVLGLLLVGTLVIAFLFFTGGTIGSTDVPIYTSAILSWAAILLGLAIASVVVFFIIHAIGNLDMLIKSAVYILILGLIVGIAYLLSSGTVTPSVLSENISDSEYRASDIGLFTTYILFGIALLSIVGSEVYKLVK
ncbi:MAG: hypothetical protein ACOCUL_00660 [Bacteroidota bacterium]